MEKMKNSKVPVGSSDYVQLYKQSHSSPENFNYRLGYIQVLIIDSLLKGYDLLDIGCGTGGYYQLVKNANTITGLDSSEEMIKEGRELIKALGIDKLSFVHGKIEQFETSKRYHAIIDAVTGVYLPHTLSNIKKISHLLHDDGIATFTFHGPKTLKAKVGRMLGRGTRHALTPREFSKILKQVPSLQTIFMIDSGRYITVFTQKKSTEPIS